MINRQFPSPREGRAAAPGAGCRVTSPTVAACRSDFNRDGAVSIADFGLLRGSFGGSLPLPSVSLAGTQATDATGVAPAAAVPSPRKSNQTATRAVLLAEEA